MSETAQKAFERELSDFEEAGFEVCVSGHYTPWSPEVMSFDLYETA